MKGKQVDVLIIVLGGVALSGALLIARAVRADNLQCLNINDCCTQEACFAQSGVCGVQGVYFEYDHVYIVAYKVGNCDDGGTGCTTSQTLCCGTVYYTAEGRNNCANSVCLVSTNESGCKNSP